MTGSFVLDYVLLVFLASCGLFQAAAALNGIRGLLIFPSRSLSIAVGLALIVAAFAWFFLSQPRNEPDTESGLNGNQQFGYFFAGMSLGLLFTLVISTLRHWRMREGQGPLTWGLDALCRANYLSCLIAAGREARTFLGNRPSSEESGLDRSNAAADGDG